MSWAATVNAFAAISCATAAYRVFRESDRLYASGRSSQAARHEIAAYALMALAVANLFLLTLNRT